MADYTSSHSGQNIDRGVSIALDWDPSIIGCKRVESTMSKPLDFDTFMEKGSWIVDYFTNGPIGLLDYTPLPFSVSETYDAGTKISVTQTVDVDMVKAYRTYTVSTSTWSDWVEMGYPKIVKSSGTGSNLVLTDSSISLNDLKEMTIQLNVALNENATITANGKGPYPIKMPDGKSVPGGTFLENSFIKVIFSKEQSCFYMIATPIPNNLAAVIEDYGGRIEGLETKTETMEKDLSDTMEQVAKNTEDIKNISGGTGFAHIVDHSTDGQANKPWTKITFNNEGVVTKGENATGSDIKVSSTDNTTIDAKITELNKVVPSSLTPYRVIVTDSTGKLIASEINSTNQLPRIIICEEYGDSGLQDVP